MNILFLCTGNSCRSILAEATFNHLAPAGRHAMSAGSTPAGYVHPRSLALLARERFVNRGSFQEVLECTANDAGHRHQSVCQRSCRSLPVYLGAGIRSHWGADPAHTTGTEAQIDAAFMRAYQKLRARIETHTALPLLAPQNDLPP